LTSQMRPSRHTRSPNGRLWPTAGLYRKSGIRHTTSSCFAASQVIATYSSLMSRRRQRSRRALTEQVVLHKPPLVCRRIVPRLTVHLMTAFFDIVNPRVLTAAYLEICKGDTFPKCFSIKIPHI